ncbi:uncharacterized protein LOC121837724 [Ixodes scapularis]|uniref:uncharacterized protein LOC121837724 n=1 Tax=Ixodes scapularis TaxID=6945 RepID=UPI001C387F7F|nr:uncharacterized protein LOC121837724 [Ixodes scapularis]
MYVDLGRGVFIKSSAWREVSKAVKSSLFLKELAAALYGQKELMERSAKGKHSPRFPNEPRKKPISPVKLMVMQDCYKKRLQDMGMPENLAAEASGKDVTGLINEKIGDLRKQAKRAEAAAAAAAAKAKEAAPVEAD